MKQLCESDAVVGGDTAVVKVEDDEEGGTGDMETSINGSSTEKPSENLQDKTEEHPKAIEGEESADSSLNNNADSEKVKLSEDSNKRKDSSAPASNVDSSEPPKKKFRRNNLKTDEDEAEVATRRQIRNERQKYAKNLMREKEMDGLIFCSKFHPTPIVVKLVQFVAPSRPIAIFNQFREPLIDLYNNFKNMGNVVNLKVSESWMREYQVLPGRTHPLMQMSGGGGFLLTGYVVDSKTF